jgi:AcrR family transcriptional regulator
MTTPRGERLRAASRQRREQQRQDVRQAILDAAAALFLEQGYQGFSLRQVAERIGYSATTIYNHFDHKDDLLFTVAEAGFARFGASIAAAASAADPLARLAAIGRAYVRFGLDNPSYYTLMFIDRADFLLGYRAGERKPRLGILDIVAQTIQEGIAGGLIRPGPADAYANALWAAVHGVVAMHSALPLLDRQQAEAAAAAAIELMIAGLRSTPA